MSPFPFDHAMLFSGGGSRFGYFLGMYAAFVENDCQPDVIFSTCGGAISAGIISAFPDCLTSQKEALMSHKMHQMLSRIHVKKTTSLLNTLISVAGRYLSRKELTRFPDLNQSALFAIENDDLAFFPFRAEYTTKALEFVFLGSKLLYTPEQVGQLRHDSPFFQAMVFGSNNTTVVLADQHFSPQSPLVKDQIAVDSTMSVQEAIRISISDIYYLVPYQVGEQYYLGGMINLIPFDLASSCARMLSLEHKHLFSKWTAVPAFESLLGFNPNHSYSHIPRRNEDIWLDTRDCLQALKHNHMKRTINWLANRIELHSPNYDRFRKMMLAQWEYGYHKGQLALREKRQGN